MLLIPSGGTPMILDSARGSNGSGHASSDYSVSSMYSSQNVSDNRGNDSGSRFEIKPFSKRELLAHDLTYMIFYFLYYFII